jgi:hypothetical protein
MALQKESYGMGIDSRDDSACYGIEQRKPEMKRSRIRICFSLTLIVLLGFSLPTVAQPLFEFHSGFWVNLHHFLYLAALSESPQTGRHAATLTPADEATLRALTPQERSSWDEAVTYYAHSVVQRDLLFDRDLAAAKNRLEDAEASPDLTDAVPAEMKSALLKSAPIYRSHFWAAHDAENRAWIAHLQPLVVRYGEGLKASLAMIYETPWPKQTVRVDAVVYANWAGAYTTLEPTRVTISTRDPANQGTAALEIVFHESSHGMMDKVQAAIDAATKAENTQHPDRAFQSGSIWHAVLFYTAGALVAERIPGYVPYADKNGLWKRAWPDPDRVLIEQDWQPHMEGKAGLRQALTKLIDDLASQRRVH